MSEVCALCKKEFDEERPVKVKKKGLKTLIRVCTEKGLDDLCRYVFTTLYTSRICLIPV